MYMIIKEKISVIIRVNRWLNSYKKKNLFPLIIALGFMTGSMLGCAASEQNLWRGNKRGDISPQKLRQMQEDRILSDDSPLVRESSISYDSAAVKKLPEMTGDELEMSGDAFLEKGNLPMAFVQYEKFLRLDPENARVHYKKGLTLLLGKMNEDAVKAFQAVVKIDPECAPAYGGAGQAFFRMRRYDEAEMNFRKAVKLDSNLWKSHNFLGIICDYQKRYKEAVDRYAAAILLMPDEGLLYNNLGMTFLMTGENEKAANAFYKALETGYSRNRVYNNLGLVLSKSGRYKEAMEAFRKGSDRARANNNMGCMYLAQGEFEKAAGCFTKAIEINPSFYVRASENLRKAKTGYGRLR